MKVLGFEGDLVLVYKKGAKWRVYEPLVCHYDMGDGKETLIVPSDFVTDLASIPRIFTWLVPRVGEWNKPAVVHDWIYAHKGEMPSGKVFSRREADLLFWSALRERRVRRTRAFLMFAAVTLGGWIVWRK